MSSPATTSGTFKQRFEAASQINSSLICVGLDPDLARLPAPLRRETDITRAIVAFNAGVIAATSDLVCAFKPNLGFYIAHGRAGIVALEETRQMIPAHIPAILDAKVGDIGSTAEAYARGYFDTWGFDAVTINPYLGEDSLEPFMRRGDKGVIVICKTSNAGSGDLQDVHLTGSGGDQSLFLTVADRVADWAERWPATLALVVGATYSTELAQVRERCPTLPILLPGIGAQDGDLEAAVRAGLDGEGGGLLVSASRSIIFAGSDRGADWTDPVRSAAMALQAEVNLVRGPLMQT